MIALFTLLMCDVAHIRLRFGIVDCTECRISLDSFNLFEIDFVHVLIASITANVTSGISGKDHWFKLLRIRKIIITGILLLCQ